MDKIEDNDKIRIWQAFASYIRNNDFDHGWRNIKNPIYQILSEQLMKPKKEIRNIILEMQPSLILSQSRYEQNLVGVVLSMCSVELSIDSVLDTFSSVLCFILVINSC